MCGSLPGSEVLCRPGQGRGQGRVRQCLPGVREFRTGSTAEMPFWPHFHSYFGSPKPHYSLVGTKTTRMSGFGSPLMKNLVAAITNPGCGFAGIPQRPMECP